MTNALERLLTQLEIDTALAAPHQFRQRLDALDQLDACLPHAYPTDPNLIHRAQALTARLEAANDALYASVRAEIQRGSRPDILLQCIPSSQSAADPVTGMAYDHLDELIAGVLQFEEPGDELIPRQAEQVFYQPTPARHIFSLIDLTALSAADVLVDLGSGLGHVPLLVSICTAARSIGIELEPAYITCARQCVHSLNLNRVAFLQQDARVADLSTGTVFYLYTPFTGSILRTVLKRLQCEAEARPIRVYSYGPCTAVLAAEPWLTHAAPPDPNQVTVFTPQTSRPSNHPNSNHFRAGP